MDEFEELKELYINKTAIVEIPPWIGSLKKLEVLSAASCKSLVGLPDSISHLVNLLTLDLNRCPRLCKLLESIGSLVKLERLSCNDHWDSRERSDLSICELPKSIGDLKILKILDINYRKKLSNLPSTISKLGNLEELDATCCENLKGEIHIDGLASLKILKLSCTSVFDFHGTFDKLSHLEELKVDGCRMLRSLSELPASLIVLKVTGQHRTFPQLSHLIHLKVLDVTDCPLLESMPELPSGLLRLHVLFCGGLREFLSLSSLEFLSYLFLKCYGELTKIEGLEGLKSLATLDVNGCGKLSNLDGLEHLESLRGLYLVSNGPILNDDKVQGLEKLKNLEKLHGKYCESLVRLDVSQLTHLQRAQGIEASKLLKKRAFSDATIFLFHIGNALKTLALSITLASPACVGNDRSFLLASFIRLRTLRALAPIAECVELSVVDRGRNLLTRSEFGPC
ncbi:hypothetical protein BT93_D1373 [Corymbia citriodora subsp. variegata]|nr:hypothetical protein BT93_D1373 [Corymbia citriodora subsp. variegata]